MTILLIEDEEPTARKLKRLLADVEPNASVVGTTGSVEESVAWLQTQPAPDLILMDIELADGQSFEIFNRVPVTCPVIFTTAYDEFAIKAFRVNSVDYLLKPVKEDDLRSALTKLRDMKRALADSPGTLESSLTDLLRHLSLPPTTPLRPELQPGRQADRDPLVRDRFLIKQGQRLFSVPLDEVTYFFSRNKLSYLKTRDAHEWMVDYTMEELERMLPPERFFRLNRQLIVELRAIEKVSVYFNGKLKAALRPAFSEEVIISRDRAGEFKVWLGE